MATSSTAAAPSRPLTHPRENYQFATSQFSQITLRSMCGQAEFDELLAEAERINERSRRFSTPTPSPGGIKVTKVEVKQVDLPY
jgi:regulator of protease activity HflC (stomatin/prohibitin superfamily)